MHLPIIEGTDRKHVVETSSFGIGAYQKRRVTVFAPAGVTYDEIIKAMHPWLDYRFVLETSPRGETNLSTTQWPSMHIAHAVNVK